MWAMMGGKDSRHACRKQPVISDALLDQLLDGRRQVAFDPNGMLDTLKKVLADRMHLGGEAADGRSNSRNGYGQGRC